MPSRCTDEHLALLERTADTIPATPAELRSLIAEVREWRSLSLTSAAKMGNCPCGAFSSRLNGAGLCMACASRSAE
jgi:hypothetical protein